MRLPIYLLVVREPRLGAKTGPARRARGAASASVKADVPDPAFRVRQQVGEPLVFLILNPNTASVGGEVLRLYRKAEAECAQEVR